VGLGYAEQLRRKQASLADALAGEPGLAAPRIDRIAGSSRPFGYRNQAKLVFRSRRRRGSPRGEVVLGVYRPGTHSVLPAERCAVHVPGLRSLLAALREQVERLEIPIFDERHREGSLRYALARWSELTGRAQLMLVAATPEPPRLERLVAALRRDQPKLGAAFLCVNPTPGNTLLSADVRRLFGPPALAERFGPIVIEARPDAFLQANTSVASYLYATALRWLSPSPEDVVVDLFCGAGALALQLAGRAGRVLGIENAPAAIASARANAKRLGLRNARFAAGDAAAVEAIAGLEGLGSPSLITANPPRRGLGAALVDAIVRIAPQRIVYVSCEPRTLASDLARFAERGYRAERLRPFDMLPQTPHVETLALLTSASPGRPSAGGSR
jgi:23S rRNA (uracil1939-C5)-methyltransferase